MTPRAPFGLVLLLLLAGCGDDATTDDAGPDDGVVTPPQATSITALGQPVLATTPGNRIAEFMATQNPLDPDHLVAAYGDYDSPGGVLNCAFSVTFDGGATWTVSEPVAGISGPYLGFDGWIDFDPWGGLHGICIRQAGPEATTEAWIYYFRSDDGGLTWTAAQQIPTDPPGRSTDKSVLGVGADGRVYAAVSGLVGWTTDNGTSWEPVQSIASGFAVLNGIVTDNQGTVHLLGLGGGQVKIQRTSDGGATWNETAFGRWQIPPGFNDQNRWVEQRPWTALPILAHDSVTDDLWVTHQTWDESYGGYRLYLYRSTDGGASYHDIEPPSFPSTTCTDPCHITHPSIAFDAAGRLGLTVQLTQDGGHLKEVWFAGSSDHGATWLDPVRLSHTDGILMDGWTNPQTFLPAPDNAAGIATGVADDPTSAHNAAAGVALSTAVSELQLRWNGEYWGLAANAQGFLAMWIEHGSDGRPQMWSQTVVVA